MKKVTGKKTAKKAVAKKVAKKAVVVVAPVVPTKSSKEAVADFLTGKTFLNSRAAFRQFKAQNPTSTIQQNYFYTLFHIFGTRSKKKDFVVSFISTGSYKNCMAAYKAYRETVTTDFVAFAYFLNVWKRHFGLTGPIRQKVAKTPKVETIKLSTLSAKEILAKANELLKEQAAAIPTNLKNKARIVKTATQLFQANGYVVA